MRSVSIASAMLACGLLAVSETVAQNVEPPFIVRDSQVPRYAPIARTARVSGTVTVDVHVENGVVTNVTPRSGPLLLFDETVRNIRTWTFEPGTSGDVTTEFEYRLRGEAISASDNPEIELRLPYKVTITTRPYQAPAVF